jgi:hypothetical protein
VGGSTKGWRSSGLSTTKGLPLLSPFPITWYGAGWVAIVVSCAIKYRGTFHETSVASSVATNCRTRTAAPVVGGAGMEAVPKDADRTEEKAAKLETFRVPPPASSAAIPSPATTSPVLMYRAADKDDASARGRPLELERGAAVVVATAAAVEEVEEEEEDRRAAVPPLISWPASWRMPSAPFAPPPPSWRRWLRCWPRDEEEAEEGAAVTAVATTTAEEEEVRNMMIGCLVVDKLVRQGRERKRSGAAAKTRDAHRP